MQKDPKDAESWVMLGRLNGYLHNTPEAEKSFNNALQVDARTKTHWWVWPNFTGKWAIPSAPPKS